MNQPPRPTSVNRSALVIPEFITEAALEAHKLEDRVIDTRHGERNGTMNTTLLFTERKGFIPRLSIDYTPEKNVGIARIGADSPQLARALASAALGIALAKPTTIPKTYRIVSLSAGINPKIFALDNAVQGIKTQFDDLATFIQEYGVVATWEGDGARYENIANFLPKP